MKIKKVAVSVFLLGIWNLSATAGSTPIVKVDGSSTVFPITEAISEEFQTSTRGAIRVTVGISGTGGGFKKFCRGDIDVQDASRPISVEEMVDCKKNKIRYIELPVAFDALTIIVNPKNNWLKDISVSQLKKIWEPSAQGTIKTWNQIDPKFPNKALKLFGAGSDSGTFDYFTEAINGKAKASRGDYTASEDDNTLVIGVSTDEGALGYLPYAYYESNKQKVKAIAVINKEGKATMPSKEHIIDTSYFPLSRPIFIYVSLNSLKKKEVKEFVKFYLSNAAELVESVKYLPLPVGAYTAGLKRIESGEAGTAFAGHNEVGVHVEDLMKRKLHE